MNAYLTEELNNAINIAESVQIIDNDEGEEISQFEITDLETANWALKRLAVVKAKINEVNELAKKEHERIELWEAQENRRLENSVNYFEGLLIKYYSAEKEKDTKFKLSTPYGKVTSTTRKKYEYNEELLFDELAGTDYIVPKYSIDKVNLKKSISLIPDETTSGRYTAISEDGVVLEGITVNDETSYTVKPAEI